ncbi:type ISP restriction/modification enzyme [Trichloromonas sp.]|uniref:type ISP restriction/modification enzyme n=1 Tax=Trichloromonas sp. TaxID=3069249 RepID=UPI002A420561|nr:type ISP restriction/modification enzyme [Trichloromonas sp.]
MSDTAIAKPLRVYLDSVAQALGAGNATEHTHRPALKILLESHQFGTTATNEPKRIACGAPDFVIVHGAVPLGYVEAKDVGVSLNDVEKSAQLKRYRASLGNLILTDYLEFRWYVDGERRMVARVADLTEKFGRPTLKPTRSGAADLQALLVAFFSRQATVIAASKELALRMAAMARLIRDTIAAAFAAEGDVGGSLHGQLEGFRRVLIHDLTPEHFADMYAQTICYGLFAARCNHRSAEPFSRMNALFDLPRTNPFLRRMFNQIAGADLDERIAWAVDDLAGLLARADMEAILADFGKRTRREDPVVHFYESFLAAYDPKLRESRGVYYTPEPVVSYIVRSVDLLLKKDFRLRAGLASSSTVPNPAGKGTLHKVQILDPAAGTGTFLHGVVDHIHLCFTGRQGMWPGYVVQHLLPRLHGFELLMAPYAVAHMKLGLLLAETGYDFQSDERLRIYLTNTLEEAHEMSGLPLFTQWIADEAGAAGTVKKDAPVMVVLGNPPYSNFGMMNKGEWILGQLQEYKRGLKEKKLNLDDDFIKFIRFGQWRIEQTGYGILAFITNHTWLDGLTHRRMRQSLMETFDDIYVLDLHGNSKKKEVAPDGGKDENVFDIQQGVAISIFVKRNVTGKGESRPCTVRHAELWGRRGDKYEQLGELDSQTTPWQELKPLAPHYFFVPKRFDSVEYEKWWSLKDIFQVCGSGVKTDRDELFIDLDRHTLEQRIQDFLGPKGLEPAFRERYRVEDSSSYDLLARRGKASYHGDRIQPFLYRPFDLRWLYYSPGLTSRPAWEVMRHMRDRENLGLLVSRQVVNEFRHVFVGNGLPNINAIDTAGRFGSGPFIPLYLYPETEEDRLLLAVMEPPTPYGRRSNLNPNFTRACSRRLGLRFCGDGKGDLAATWGPEDLFHYLYAVFHSPAYRDRYAEFLKIDFPRLPLTENSELFRKLCAVGERLVALHLLNTHVDLITGFPEVGDDVVENVRFEKNRVWINTSQYFDRVPEETWGFQVGGYQVCQKWLKDRTGRRLSFDELLHYQRIVAALTETRGLMARIDSLIEVAGGWPLEK